MNFLKIISLAMNTLQSFGEFLNNYATLILVFITAVYAYFTYRMVKIMARQTTSDIRTSNIIIGSPFIENWFLERVKNRPEQVSKNSFFEFKLLFDIYNRSSGSGSIEKPVLIIRFKDDGFEYEIYPVTKESYQTDIRKEGAMTTYRIVENDFGGAIFLRGGEFQKVELKYTLDDLPKELLTHIKEKTNSIEYFIRFNDNLNKKYLLKVKEVRPVEKTYRR